jgi:hypothetical protein
MISAGQPLRTVAAHFGISMSRVSTLSSRLASRLRGERDHEILRLRRAGWTYDQLAERFRLSCIRVRRICAAAAELPACAPPDPSTSPGYGIAIRSPRCDPDDAHAPKASIGRTPGRR